MEQYEQIELEIQEDELVDVYANIKPNPGRTERARGKTLEALRAN